MDMSISQDGVDLIQHFEGCAKRVGDQFHAYPDPGTGREPWTIGFGSTGPDIGPDTVWNWQQCNVRFKNDLRRFSARVSQVLGTAPTTQNQFDAMVSLAYNIGMGNFQKSSVLRFHLAGDHPKAAQAFRAWYKSNGQALAGLIDRRAKEASFYLK